MEVLPKLALIVPCYNEEEIIKESAEKLLSILKDLTKNSAVAQDSYICFVDDGSADNTWNLLQDISIENSCIKAIRFACNFGHQNAIMAGMCENSADIYITLDCDMQDDPNKIFEMIQKYKENNVDVVYGVRSSRETDSFLKRITAQMFYRFCSFLGIKSLYDHADYRLVTDKVVNVLRAHKEFNLYLRALIYKYSFKYDIVYYTRLKRIGGTPKYNFIKSFNLAINGITSFSQRPVRIILFLSIITFIISLVIRSEIFFVGGLNLFAIYIVGEYLFANSVEIKNRPKYVISEKTDK